MEGYEWGFLVVGEGGLCCITFWMVTPGDTSGPVWMHLPTYLLITDKVTNTHNSRIGWGGGDGWGRSSSRHVSAFQEYLLCVYMHVCVNM